jgi:hypothetical protein
MKERVFYIDAKGTTRPTCVRRAIDLFHLANAVGDDINGCRRASGGEFIASRSASKRKLYVAARKGLVGGAGSLSDMASLGFFVKQETTLWTKEQVPRIISPRSPEFNYLLGKYLQPIEHSIYDSLAKLFGSDCVVSKGLTQEAKGALIAQKLRPGWVCVGLDASRFDQTIGAELLAAEHQVYLRAYNDCRLLRALLKHQLDNRGRSICLDGVVKARIGAMRCSGDQNTSLGNCIISCLLAKLYAVESGLVEVDVLNDGDDLLLFVPATSLPILDGLHSWYASWGLRMKVEPPAYEPEQVEFCQHRPVWTPRGYVLVRNVSKALNTDFAGPTTLGDDSYYLRFLRAVGLCGMTMAAGIPIYQELYHWAVRNGKTGKFTTDMRRGAFYQSRVQQRAGYLAKLLPVHADTRISFEKAFGITPSDQIAHEGNISGMLLGRLHHDLVEVHPYFGDLRDDYRVDLS